MLLIYRLWRKWLFPPIKGMILTVNLHSFTIHLQLQPHISAAFNKCLLTNALINTYNVLLAAYNYIIVCYKPFIYVYILLINAKC